MAQHPFGPIENQLIVGHFNKNFGPSKVKLRFNTKELSVPNEQTDPGYALLEPVFYGWSPANGNSSSDEWKVGVEHRLVHVQELTSRGLGYRITFTMPEQEIRTEETKSWPQLHFELLSGFGDKVLFEIKQDFRPMPKTFLISKSRFKGIMNLVSKFKTLTVESTLEHIKVVANCQSEYCFPVYDPSGSPLSARLKAASEEYSKLIECGIDAAQGESTTRVMVKLLFDLITGTLGQFRGNQATIQPNRIDKLKQYIDGLASAIEKSAKSLKCNSDFQNEICDLGRVTRQLESEVKSWCDGLLPNPPKPSLSFVNSIYKLIRLNGFTCGRKGESKLFWGSLNKHLMEGVRFAQSRLEEIAREVLAGCHELQKLQNSSVLDIWHRTKHFTFQQKLAQDILRGEISYFKTDRPEEGTFDLLRPDGLNQFAELNYSMIPGTDLLLEDISNKQKHFNIIDLNRCRPIEMLGAAHKWRFRLPLPSHCQSESDLGQLSASKYGIVALAHQSGKDYLEFYPLSSDLRVKASSWSSTLLNSFYPPPSELLGDSRLQMARIKHSTHTRRIYFMGSIHYSGVEGRPAGLKGSGLLLLSLHHSNLHHTFKLEAQLFHQQTSGTNQYYHGAWIQSRKGRMYAFCYHYALSLDVFVELRKKFIQVLNKPIHTIRLQKSFVKLEKLEGMSPEDQVGLFGVGASDLPPSPGFNAFKLSRLYIKD